MALVVRHTFLLCLAVGLSTPLLAESDRASGSLEEVLVYGRSSTQIGEALSGSQGYVGLGDIALPPLLRVGELIEAVPGMVATQHSGTGKANQYFLRGFNLDHGTDFAAQLNGMPLNMRTHGHGQGYLDLNPIIPELVTTIEYQKGPYNVRQGDFSSAGSVAFTYGSTIKTPLVKISAGNFGYRRAMVATGNQSYTVALDSTRYAGPWALDENLRQNKGHLGWSLPLDRFATRLQLDYYDSTWRATDQIPSRAVNQGTLEPLGFIDPDLGGSSRRVSLNASLSDETTIGNLYLVSSDFQLFSNFTYFLENPETGDEFEQLDTRTIWGGSFEKAKNVNESMSVSIGVEFQHNEISKLGLNQTSSRQQMSAIRDDLVDQTSIGVFLDTTWQVNQRLRINFGSRADYFEADVTAQQIANSGNTSETQLSPKLNIGYRVADALELYANVGRGMHSNDARGAVISLDPNTGTAIEKVPLLVPSLGREVGLRYEQGETLRLSLTAFDIELDSELVFVGDAGSTEANDGSVRRGVEASLFLNAGPKFQFDLAYTKTQATYTGVPSARNAIPGAMETTISGGINSIWNDNWSSSIRVRYLGGAPLVEDRSISSGRSLLTNAAVTLQLERTEVKLEALNLLDSNDVDIAYYYDSRLVGEPVQGVSDVHYHPLEPRSIRLTIQRSF